MAPPDSLPRQLTPLVGRDHDVADITRLLSGTPLLTLSGAAGVGKTRLALEVASRSAEQFDQGVRFVSLAALTDPALVVPAVAAACAVPGDSLASLADGLHYSLASQALLLVLDNCEHLIEACADVVATLLDRCPTLQVLATSREPLNIDGEITRRVSPLSVPRDEHINGLPKLLESSAVRLFEDRAQAVEPNFAVSDDNAAAIARICIQLDGIPLAIELAAALVRVLSPRQLADRLTSDPRLLRHSARRSLARHQTLEAAIDRSDDLLSETQRALMRRLAVFAGGWSLEAAEAICAGTAEVATGDVFGLLTQLVDKSLVVVEHHTTGARYRLLEPIRQHYLGKLTAAAELAPVRAAHLAWYQRLAEASEAPGGGPDEVVLLDRVEVEHDNFRAALGWALDAREAEAAVRLTAALFRFWDRRGYLVEGCRWLEAALQVAPEAGHESRARALNGAAQLWYWRGDRTRADALAEQAIRLSQAVNARRGVAWGLLTRGQVAEDRRDVDRAQDLYDNSLAAGRAADDMVLVSLTLVCLGRLHVWTAPGGDATAARIVHQALAMAREANSRHATRAALMVAGDAAWRSAQPARAVELWSEALETLWDVRDWRSLPQLIARLGWGIAEAGHSTSAASVLAAADRHRVLIGLAWRHHELAELTRALARLHGATTADDFGAAWTHGASLERRAALAFALAAAQSTVTPATVTPSSAKTGAGPLTPREAAVIKLVAEGRTNRDIADELVISPRTVKRHMDNIFDKLGVSSRAAAAMAAQRAGLF